MLVSSPLKSNEIELNSKDENKLIVQQNTVAQTGTMAHIETLKESAIHGNIFTSVSKLCKHVIAIPGRDLEIG